MSFHQAVIDALYATAAPTEADAAFLQSLSLSGAEDGDVFASSSATLADVQSNLERAIRDMWDAVRSGEAADLDELARLIELVDRRTTEARVRHQLLVNTMDARRAYLLDRPSIDPLRAERFLDAADRHLDFSTRATNIFVRFYYELIALRAEIERERPTQTFATVDDLLDSLR